MSSLSKLVYGYILISLFDLSSTIIGRSIGLVEANPLLDLPIPAFIIIKIDMVTLVILLLLRRRSVRYATYAVVATAGVVVWNITRILSVMRGA